MSNLNEGLLKRWQSFSESMKTQMSNIFTQHKETEISLNKLMETSTRSYDLSNDRTTFPATQSFDVEITSPALQNSQNTSELTGSGNAHTNEPRLEQNKTLLIGDSILKGISKRGLQSNVDVGTLPGKKSRDIYTRLLTDDISKYTKIVIYVGGNDAASGTSRSVYETLRSTFEALRHQCTVYLCTLCPRTDRDIGPVNEEINKLFMETGAVLIDCYHSFIYTDKNTIRPFYFKDGIHLCPKGSSRLVSTINTVTPIVKSKHSSARELTHRVAATRYSR
ncbi:hypothetical protein DPMN_165030 [Dreissena polymorpha]|uniref:SGNH hydrolase-type esterase domain-containing protein n=1 Tax=Dreissena polymorpha TaxID=45954 RepID=A0A9D4EWX3_DREPO|nr:hypothetical protein DPMN_165030 [Dreissena polymorpha]